MIYRNSKDCIYNMLYIKFNEAIQLDKYFSYDIQYPSFYAFNNPMFNINSTVLSDINSTIVEDITTFGKGIKEEQDQINNLNIEQGKDKISYKIASDFAVTFNKNYMLSTILSLMAIVDNSDLKYNELNNYNFNLLTGEEILLKDVFMPNIDYLKLINTYIKYKINQNKDLYYEDVFIDISEDQAFYITDDSVVIYFGVDEIAPEDFGIPKFSMDFNKFAPYINPMFYCFAQNVSRKNKFKF